MPSMTEITCKCGCERRRMVRAAEVARGWGRYYSKSCKAKEQWVKQGRPVDKDVEVMTND